MNLELNIVKRLEMLKVTLELGDDDIIELQLQKLEAINELSEIVKFCKILPRDVDKILKLIDSYIYMPRGNILTTHQQNIFDEICNEFENILSNDKNEISYKNNFVSLSGSAGVGKTFVTSKLIEYFIKKKDYKILLTTPTHKSLAVAKYMINNINLKVPTKTLQSYLDIILFTDYSKGTKRFMRDKVDVQADYEKNLDILIVDESSMISDELLKFIKENLEQNKLKTVLFIGDPYQLPPIDEGQNGVQHLLKKYELTEVVRQAKDSYIKIIANNLKECIKNKKFIPVMDIFDVNKYSEMEVFYDLKDMYDSFVKGDNWYSHNIVLSYTNQNVDEFNRVVRYKYWVEQGIYPKEPIIEGELLVFNESYKRTVQNSETVKVIKVEKKEDKYITLKDEDNSLQLLKYFECIGSDGREFNTVHPDHYKLYNKYLKDLSEIAKKATDKEEKKKLWRKYFVIKENYADLKYIHASTIHKSQGSTYQNVYIDLSSLIQFSKSDLELAYRLMYVAVTRAAKDIKILL